MSLAQHVTSIEGVDREPVERLDHEVEGRRTLWRRLSYDAFPPVDNEVVPQPEPRRHIAAYKVSIARRFAQVAFAAIACCLASGIIFGFASLKPVLIAEGVYRELCSPDDEGGHDTPCAKQDLRLNFFFIIGSISTNVSALLVGAVLDRYGRRTCYIVSTVLLAVGCILMGYAFAIPEFDGYLAGNLFLGCGGTFLFVPSFQLASAFPKRTGLIVALITGAFDTSAAVFLFYRLGWEASRGRFTPSQFFFGFMIVPIVILVAEWSFMPARAYHTTPELERKIQKAKNATRDIHDSDHDISSENELYRVRSHRSDRRQAKLARIEELVGGPGEREERARQVEHQKVASGIWGALHGLSAHRQMLTPWFIFLLLLTVVQMLKMNYFIATVRSQYRYMLQSEDAAADINHFFDAALPVGGIVTTPFIGLVLNNFSVAVVLAVLTGFIALMGVLNCLPFLWAGYATVVLFVVFRPFYYSAMSDYTAKVFGFASFGRVYGMLICISGLVQFVQSGLDALTLGPLGGDPTPINIFITVIGTVFGLVLTLYVHVKSQRYDVKGKQRRERAQGTESERLGLISEEGTADYGT